MKKIKRTLAVFAAVLALTAINDTQAQNDESRKRMEFGLRFMPTFSTFNVNTANNQSVSGNVTMGLGAGVFLGYNFTDNIGIQAELIYSSITHKSNDRNTERKINFRNVNVPILLSLNTGKSRRVNLNVVAGPQIGFNVGSSLTTSGSNDTDNDQPILSVKKNDLGFAYGAGLDFALNEARTLRFGLGYRGVIGLIDISNNNQSAVTGSYYVLDRTFITTHSGYVGLSMMF